MINLYIIRPKGFNIGNDVIYLGVNYFIRQSFKKHCNIISLPATNKYESNKKAGITAQTVHEINQFGDGVIIGGGNLYENGEIDVNEVALKALNKPLMIFSVSRGKIYNSEFKMVDRTDVMPDEKIKSLNKKAFISLSRDVATKKYLDELGCRNILGGCPTLFINEMPQHYVPISHVDKTDALISIRTPHLMNIPVVRQYQLREELLQIIEIVRSNEYKNIKLLCHDHRDISFAASFRGIEYLYTEDVYTYLTFLKNTRLNISYRLHSCLPCMSYGIPTIKISYDQRALSLLKTLGMGEWNIDLFKDNVIGEVKKRINNLEYFDFLRKKNSATIWADMRSIIMNSCDAYMRCICEK